MYGQYGATHGAGQPQQAWHGMPQAPYGTAQNGYGTNTVMLGPSGYGAGYAQQAQPFAPYQQQQPSFAPIPQLPAHQDQSQRIAHDPTAFEQLFREHLSTLTFNSKQIINMLTLMAEDHKERMSAVVARVLDSHITSVRRATWFASTPS